MTAVDVARKMICPILSRFEPPLMKVVSWGTDFPDKTFLVVRRHEPKAGLCSLIVSNLSWIRFAERNGMVPVIDMQTLPNIYQRSGECGKINAWESFFHQPRGYTLDDIAHASRVIVATGIMPVSGFMPGFCGDLDEWRDVVRRSLCIVEENIAPFSCAEFDECGFENVIGVLARGTDYVRLRPKNHPIQPTADQLIAKVREFGESQRVYLVTEDMSIREAFQKAFGDKLVVSMQDCVMNYHGGYLADCRSVKNNRQRGLAYLKAVSDLARCPRVVAGLTSGTLVAALMADKSQQSYYFDLGRY